VNIGDFSFLLRAEKDRTAQVYGFWSLTMYDIESYLLPNELNRYALGSQSKLDYARDGSLTLSMQKDHPGKDKETNWLPALEEGFRLATLF
jgi:hypothetical protein